MGIKEGFEKDVQGIKDKVEGIIDSEIEPRAEKVDSWIRKNGKKAVVYFLIGVGVVCLAAILNEVYPVVANFVYENAR